MHAEGYLRMWRRRNWPRQRHQSATKDKTLYQFPTCYPHTNVVSPLFQLETGICFLLQLSRADSECQHFCFKYCRSTNVGPVHCPQDMHVFNMQKHSWVMCGWEMRFEIDLKKTFCMLKRVRSLFMFRGSAAPPSGWNALLQMGEKRLMDSSI